MGKKLLTEGLQKILETFDDEDCPHEQYFRSILNEVIKEQDDSSHSGLNGVLFALAEELNEEAKENMADARKEFANKDHDSGVGLSVIAGVLNGISNSLLRVYKKAGK